MASAVPKVPASGVCYISSYSDASKVDVTLTPPKPCSEYHAVETYYVGQFPAEVALPLPGTPDYAKAYDECEHKAKDFLGDEWFNGRLYLTLTVPLIRQWEGGGRWYRCELIETKTMYDPVVTTRNGSLAGSMTGAAPLAQHCAKVIDNDTKDDSWDDLEAVDCATPHEAEFAGAFKAAGIDEPTDKQREALYDNCWAVVAAFLHGTKNGIRVGYLVWTTAGAAWKRGDHWVRCYVWAGENKKIVGSVKGIGNAEPKH
jgi:hypothetical protein